jgi:hypothetical protein
VLPFVYEADNLEEWEDRFFWSARRKRSRAGKIGKAEVLFDDDQAGTPDTPVAREPVFEDAKPLAEELLDTLVDLLFYSEFTLPKTPPGKPKVSYAIWQTGVGCHTPITSTKEFENNRTEVLRLILVMCSRAMYMTPTILPVKGVRAITYLTTSQDKQIVLSTLCSLMNTTLKYNPASWRVPYDHMVFKDNRQLLASYCLQLLLVLVLYPIPETQHGVVPKNYFRHFLGRLHRPQDFQFIVDGMTRILNQPVRESKPSIMSMVRLTRNLASSEQLVSSRKPKVHYLGPGDAHAFLGGTAMQQTLPLLHHQHGAGTRLYRSCALLCARPTHRPKQARPGQNVRFHPADHECGAQLWQELESALQRTRNIATEYPNPQFPRFIC